MSFSLWGVPGTLAMLVAWAAALVILRASPERMLNRWLAVVLAVEGLWIGGALGVLFFLENKAAVRVTALVGTAASVSAPFIYLAFLGAALPTRWVGPLRSTWVVRLLIALAVVSAASVFLVPHWFIGELYVPGWAPWNFRLVGLGQAFSQFQGVVYLFGFAAALAVYAARHCCGPVRRQSLWLAIAFGFRDAWLGATLVLYPLIRPVPIWGDFVYNPMEGFVYLTYVMLLSYGVLQAQLFDIELRVRMAVRRSTLVALIATSFFLASEVLEEFVPVDGMLLGILTAGIIVLCLRLLQRLAEHVINRLLPGEPPGRDELKARKLDVYRAALEGALQDGVVTEREEAILARLRSKLEISDEEASVVRQEFTRAA